LLSSTYFKPHRLHAVHEMRPIATMSYIAWSVCLSVCVGHTGGRAKTAERIEMPFGGLTYVGPRNHILDGIQIPPEGVLLRGHVPANGKLPIYAWWRMRCSGSRSERIHSPPQEITWRYGDAASCQMTLDACFTFDVRVSVYSTVYIFRTCILLILCFALTLLVGQSGLYIPVPQVPDAGFR